MDNSYEGRYDMILSRYLFIALVLDLKISEQVTEGGDGPYECCTAPMTDISTYEYIILSLNGKIKPEQSLCMLT